MYLSMTLWLRITIKKRMTGNTTSLLSIFLRTLGFIRLLICKLLINFTITGRYLTLVIIYYFQEALARQILILIFSMIDGEFSKFSSLLFYPGALFKQTNRKNHVQIIFTPKRLYSFKSKDSILTFV